jgi:hypothetical protein
VGSELAEVVTTAQTVVIGSPEQMAASAAALGKWREIAES